MLQNAVCSVCFSVLTLSLIATESSADCCAGGRGEYLAYGSGLRRPGPARPFQGITNPRYANTSYIGGPPGLQSAQHPAFPHLVSTRPFINYAAMREAAFQRQASSIDFAYQMASDSKLLNGEPVESLVDRDDANDQQAWQPTYPGQTHFAPNGQQLRRETSSRGTSPAQHPDSAQGEQPDTLQDEARSAKRSPRAARSAHREAARGRTTQVQFTSLRGLQQGAVLPQGSRAAPNLVGIEKP